MDTGIGAYDSGNTPHQTLWTPLIPDEVAVVGQDGHVVRGSHRTIAGDLPIGSVDPEVACVSDYASGSTVPPTHACYQGHTQAVSSTGLDFSHL